MLSADDVSPDLRKRDESEHSFQLDGWVRWDMPGDFTEYYDLIKEPERYTEYQGQRIWKFIHERICFQLRLEDFENAWKNDFNRFISGMHSAVSVHVVDGMPENQRLAEYRRRLRDQKGAVQNLHFGYMLLLCAIHQVSISAKYSAESTRTRMQGFFILLYRARTASGVTIAWGGRGRRCRV
jgi:hypothetical protein